MLINMAHGSLLFSFSFCLESVIQSSNALSRKLLCKRTSPPLKLPARKLSCRCLASAYDQGETQTLFKAPAGLVECTDRGCKPVFHEDDLTTLVSDNDDWVCLENAGDIVRSRIKAYHEKLSQEDNLESGNFYKDFAGYLNHVWMQKELANKYYEEALKKERSNAELVTEYAEFVWKRLKNREMADQVLEEAVELQECADNVRVWG
ncbi:hypothetical protein KI387_012507, partial [Taxus chinensis]